MTRTVRTLVVMAAALLPSVAAAQAAPAPPPPRHEGSVEAAFVGVSGNASSNTFGLGAETIARPGAWVFKHKFSFVRNETDGTVSSQALVYTPRAERTLSARVGAFAEYTYFRDRFAGVANRNAIVGGVSLKLVTDDRQTLALDLGGGYLNEKRLAGEDISSAIYTIGSAYKLKLSSTADLSDDVSLTGDASNSSDWRISHGIAVPARLTEALSLKASNVVRYAHAPAPGFKTTDTVTSVALVAKFPATK